MTLRQLLSLALADLRDEWPSALCMLFAVVAILIPIMVLMSLRAGVLEELRDELGDSARVRELRTTGEPIITRAFLDTIKADPLVDFVAPKAKFLAAGTLVQTLDKAKQEEADLEATAPGDPLFDATLGPSQIAMSKSLSQKLGIAQGQTVSVIVDRIHPERGREVEVRRFVVAHLIPPQRLGQTRSLVLIAAPFLIATEIWREDPGIATFALALEQAEGPRGATHRFSGMRIYSTGIDTVIPLKTALARRGIETDSQADQIRLVERLESSLTIAISILAALMLAGLVTALSAIQWGWVERKKYDYSYLRLLGVGWKELALIPMLQAGIISSLGVALSSLVIVIGQPLVNGLFRNRIGDFGTISVARASDILLVGAIGLIVALLSALVASRSATKFSPIIALRRT